MTQVKIAVLVGSLRKESLNARLAAALARMAPPELRFQRTEIGDLPPFSQDNEASPAPSVTRLKNEVSAAQGVLFVTPEYNRSVPGVLKNAIDHASRPWGKSVWAGKPAAVLGVSVGAIGTAMAQQHLRNVLAYLNMPTLSGNEAFIHWKDGLVVDGEVGPASKEFAQNILNNFLAWVKQNAAKP